MPSMREMLADLEKRRAQSKEMGGADKAAKPHSRGKLTCRERQAKFFDDGAFFEIGSQGTRMGGGHMLLDGPCLLRDLAQRVVPDHATAPSVP